MSYVKVVSYLNKDMALSDAKNLSDAGIDEIHFIMNGEKDLSLMKDITRAIDVPLYVRMCPKRMEDVKKALYAGATKVCINTEDPDLIKEITDRFGDKIDAYVTYTNANAMASQIATLKELSINGLFIGNCKLTEEVADVLSFIKHQFKMSIAIAITENDLDFDQTAEFIKNSMVDSVTFDIDDASTVVDMKDQLREHGIKVNTFESSLSFDTFKVDQNGLIPVIVQDYKTSEVLMMAYMNKESFDLTVKTGRMTYYSRSRQEIWVKGLTSGHYQYVKSLAIDCDKDTILAKVAQVGAACHTGNRSCFYTDLVKKEYNETNPLKVFEEEYNIILDRKNNPKEGSYTNYLFDKGIDKILKKVGEEATEIVIAAKNPDAEELKYEICDFLYHAMVLMVECDVTWEDITSELVERR